jgi:hypothetical protein
MAKTVTEGQVDRFGRVVELVSNPTAGNVAEFNAVYAQLPQVGKMAARLSAIKAACVAGWILTPETEVHRRDVLEAGRAVTRVDYLFDGVNVDELTPAEAWYYGDQVLRHFDALVYGTLDEKKS